MNSTPKQRTSFDAKFPHHDYVSEEGGSRFREQAAHPLIPTPNHPTHRPKFMHLLFLTSAISLVLIYGVHALATPATNPGSSTSGGFEIQKSWAQYSPYFAAGQYEDPPRHCKVVQVL